MNICKHSIIAIAIEEAFACRIWINWHCFSLCRFSLGLSNQAKVSFFHASTSIWMVRGCCMHYWLRAREDDELSLPLTCMWLFLSFLSVYFYLLFDFFLFVGLQPVCFFFIPDIPAYVQNEPSCCFPFYCCPLPLAVPSLAPTFLLSAWCACFAPSTAFLELHAPSRVNTRLLYSKLLECL